MVKEKVNRFISEIVSYDTAVIESQIHKKLANYRYEDYDKIPMCAKLEVHYWYDLLFFVNECKNIGELLSWMQQWQSEKVPNRFKISGKYNDKKFK